LSVSIACCIAKSSTEGSTEKDALIRQLKEQAESAGSARAVPRSEISARCHGATARQLVTRGESREDIDARCGWLARHVSERELLALRELYRDLNTLHDVTATLVTTSGHLAPPAANSERCTSSRLHAARRCGLRAARGPRQARVSRYHSLPCWLSAARPHQSPSHNALSSCLSQLCCLICSRAAWSIPRTSPSPRHHDLKKC
jgi:hypothetical protein